MTSNNTLTREELLNAIHDLAAEIDEQPTTLQMNEMGAYSVAPYYRVFGSWSSALQAAGFDVTERSKTSPDALLAELNRLADNGPPTMSMMKEDGAHSPSTYQSHFGSWNDALRAAGFEPPTSGTKITTEELLTELERLNTELGHTPSEADMDAHGAYSSRTYRNTFNSWNDALETEGLSVTTTEPISDDELLTEIQRLRDTLGKAPSMAEMNTHGAYHTSTYWRRFGSWTAALTAAGVDTADTAAEPANKITKEELIAELHRLHASGDSSAPATTTMRDHGAYSPGTYVNRFGSWENALAEAGLNQQDTSHTANE